MALRRVILVGGVLCAILLGMMVLKKSPGYQLQPTVLTELNSVSTQLDSGTQQLSQVTQRTQLINQAIAGLQKHLQDDINTYHEILAKAGQ